MGLYNGPAIRKADQNHWEYLLVAHPDQPVYEKLLEEKKFFDDGYGYAARTLPGITITQFLAKEQMEGTLIRWIQNICRMQTAFTVTLNNYSGFPPHTIYLRIQDPGPFEHLAHQLKIIDGFVQDNDCPPVHVHEVPHLPIASCLPEHIYNEAIASYAHRSFHESFKVDKLLLTRRASVHDNLELVNTFTLASDLISCN